MNRLALAALATLVLAFPVRADAGPAKITLKKGDKIIFLGDSITQAGVGPKGYVTLVGKALEEKHKDLGVEVVGAGISGNKVPDLQGRLERDVLKKKPTIVVIYIGINDVWHKRGTSKEKFEEGLKDVIGRIQKEGAQVLLCTPSVIGEKTGGGNEKDKMLDEYSDVSRSVAKALKVPVCDLRKAFTRYLKENNPTNKERGVLTGDGVHLNDAGNKFVAETVLECLGN